MRKPLLLLCLLITIMLSAVIYTAAGDDDVKPAKISALGKKTVTVTAGKEFELKVRTTPDDADDDYLSWKIISGSRYVEFAEDDRRDDEIELKAKKAGTAKIRCTIRGTKKRVTFTVKVKAAPKTSKEIEIRGKQKRTVEVGDDFHLKIKKYSGLKEKYLEWNIRDTSIVRFDDDDRTDDEVEFEAKKTGTTTITCTDTKTGYSVTFTVTVVPELNHDHDDD